VKVFPALGPVEQQIRGLLQAGIRRMLISYHYDRKRQFREKVARYCDPLEVEFMLDSGAFSVWTRGVRIPLDEYLDWSAWWIDQQQGGEPVRVVNLDVIPGQPGRGATEREVTESVKRSARNADRMRREGFRIVEVYHPAEPLSALEGIVRRRQDGDLIGIGSSGKGFSSQAYRMLSIARAFKRVRDLTSLERFPPVHGFAVSPDSPIAPMFPWYSIDASSWNIFDRYGKEVRRDGRLQKTSAFADLSEGRTVRGKTSKRPVAALYYHRVASRWGRLEQGLTDTWEGRGVHILDGYGRSHG
jgi:hypothetical protein